LRFIYNFVSFLLSFLVSSASVVQHGHDIEQMRGKVATAATHEVRKHAAAAAQAVAAAREATMELDKVIGFPFWIPLYSCELLQTKKGWLI
jgi:hypothetical protein